MIGTYFHLDHVASVTIDDIGAHVASVRCREGASDAVFILSNGDNMRRARILAAVINNDLGAIPGILEEVDK